MPLDKRKTKAAFKSNVSEMMRSGHPQAQALAAAYRVKRGYADGGAPYALDAYPEEMLNTPSGQRPLVGGGLRNAVDMALQSSPVAKAKNYASQFIDAAKMPGDVWSGREPMHLGFRREDYTDDPQAPQPNARAIASGVSLGDVMSMGAMPVAAARGVEKSALGVGAVPKVAPSEWNAKLSAALQAKDREEFPKLFEAIKGLPPDELKTLAKEFYGGGNPRNAKQALEQIWSRWQKLEAFRIPTSANRSAFAAGGTPKLAPISPPYFARAEARGLSHTGPINSMVPGRTDHHGISVPSGSYVLPADHLSSLGQGNTAAGMAVVGRMFPKSGPYGSPSGTIKHGMGPPKPPGLPRMKHAAGGNVEMAGEPVPIYAAGGEFVIAPEDVANVGAGDLKHGHAVLDHWVKSNRKKHIKTLQNLPGPAKD